MPGLSSGPVFCGLTAMSPVPCRTSDPAVAHGLVTNPAPWLSQPFTQALPSHFLPWKDSLSFVLSPHCSAFPFIVKIINSPFLLSIRQVWVLELEGRICAPQVTSSTYVSITRMLRRPQTVTMLGKYGSINGGEIMGATSLGLLSSSSEDRMFIGTVFTRRNSETHAMWGLVVYVLDSSSNPSELWSAL